MSFVAGYLLGLATAAAICGFAVLMASNDEGER